LIGGVAALPQLAISCDFARFRVIVSSDFTMIGFNDLSLANGGCSASRCRPASSTLFSMNAMRGPLSHSSSQRGQRRAAMMIRRPSPISSRTTAGSTPARGTRFNSSVLMSTVQFWVAKEGLKTRQSPTAWGPRSPMTHRESPTVSGPPAIGECTWVQGTHSLSISSATIDHIRVQDSAASPQRSAHLPPPHHIERGTVPSGHWLIAGRNEYVRA
jgi:hypothetical protein